MTVNPGEPDTRILGKPDRPKSFDDGHDGQPHRDDLDERADQGLVGHGVMDDCTCSSRLLTAQKSYRPLACNRLRKRFRESDLVPA